MNKGKKFLRFILCLTIMLCMGCPYSCVKAKSSPVSSCVNVRNAIAGKWLWIETTGGLAMNKTNPSITGYIKEIDFNKNRTYRIYKNNELVEKGSYKIIRRKCITGNYEYLIQFSNGSEEIADITKDTLYLAQNVYDGYCETYIRMQ